MPTDTAYACPACGYETPDNIAFGICWCRPRPHPDAEHHADRDDREYGELRDRRAEG